jgi:hypothetical protein
MVSPSKITPIALTATPRMEENSNWENSMSGHVDFLAIPPTVWGY